MLGMEYNRTSQFKKSMYEGHYSNATDLTYTMNFFSIPLGLRLTMGTKTKFFIEAGGFADLMISAKRTGTLGTYATDTTNQVNYTEQQLVQKVGLSSSFGLYGGIGVLIPISKIELVVKPDYKLGLNKLYSEQEDIYNRYFRLTIGIRIK